MTFKPRASPLPSESHCTVLHTAHCTLLNPIAHCTPMLLHLSQALRRQFLYSAKGFIRQRLIFWDFLEFLDFLLVSPFEEATPAFCKRFYSAETAKKVLFSNTSSPLWPTAEVGQLHNIHQRKNHSFPDHIFTIKKKNGFQPTRAAVP